MRTLDLTKSVRLVENTTNPFEATYLDPGVPSIASGALWADTKANTLRLVPGTGSLGMAASDLSAPTVKNYVEPKLDEVWNYDIGKKRWAMEKVELDPSTMFGKDQASVWVDKVRKGFLLGGAHGVHDTYEALTDVLPGHLITYDADTGIWTNETTNFPAPRFGASMVYVEGVGKQGALVVMVGMGMGYKKSTVSSPAKMLFA